MKRSCLIIALLFAIVSAGWAQVLTNGGFESCVNEFSFAGTGWSSWGSFRNQSWAAHDGNRGAYLPGWSGPADGGLYQDVASVGLGPYTVSMWTLQESGFNGTNYQLKIEWYASDHATKVQEDTVTNIAFLPKDGFWHHQFVVGVATAAALAYVRPVIYCQWGAQTTTTNACMIDDIQVVQGSYTGIPLIGIDSIELGQADSWRGSHWGAASENHWGPATWANRSGLRGVAVQGWSWSDGGTNYSPTNIVNQMAQAMTMVGTGTYSFSAWMSRESDIRLSNTEMRIEFYDQTCSNKVQADAVTNFAVPNDNWWREYYVVGTCTNPNVYEVRPVIQVRWDRITNGGNLGARIDDVRFRRGTHDGYSVQPNWGYHSAVGGLATLETVPGTNVGPFLQINYNTHTNTFYVLAATNLAKYAADGDGAQILLRTAYQKPEDAAWVEKISPMTRVGSVTLTSAAPFHGQPSSGSQVVDLWSVSLPQPTNISGAFYTTNAIRVYYSPIFQSTNGIVATDLKYLALANGEITNALGQSFTAKYANRDYFYDNLKPATWAAFTNGGFENPAGVGVLNLDGTGWSGVSSGLERSDWGWRSGARALLWYGWIPGSAHVFQDVATTGGMFSFSSYVRIEGGVTNLTSLSLRMEWYATNDVLVQVNERSLLDITRDFNYHAASVVGACYVTNLAYVRLSMQGEYGPASGGQSIQFDDAQFLPVNSQLQNGEFEALLDGSGWLYEGDMDRHDWGPAPNTNVVGFHGWNPGRAHMYQDVATTGGVLKLSTRAKLEPGATNVSVMSIRMEWCKGDGTVVQTNITSLIDTMPHTYQWEEIYAAGACQVPGVEYARVVFDGVWGPSSSAENKSAMFDGVQLVAVNTSLENPGFEIGSGASTPGWYSWSKELTGIEGWGGHTGTNLVAFRGWPRNAFLLNRYESTVEQPLSVAPGKYAFSIWVARDTAFTLTNGELRIEWYGGDYPTKIQADTVMPLTIPAGSGWTLYTVTGQCVSAGLRIAKPVVFAQWDTLANDSLKVDDATFTLVAAEDTTDGIPNTWLTFYGLGLTNGVANGDDDNDGYTTLEEYAGDTIPTDIASHFPRATNSLSGDKSVMIIVVNPSSAARVYDAWWKTNLLDTSAWQGYGLTVPGNGGLITLTVTNGAGWRYYRSGARVP